MAHRSAFSRTAKQFQSFTCFFEKLHPWTAVRFVGTGLPLSLALTLSLIPIQGEVLRGRGQTILTPFDWLSRICCSFISLEWFDCSGTFKHLRRFSLRGFSPEFCCRSPTFRQGSICHFFFSDFAYFELGLWMVFGG
jgi:hypothetical protein